MIPLWIEKTFHYSSDSLFTYLPQNKPNVDKLKNCRIISHRGEHDNVEVLENTMKAFDAASEKGVWGIEFDVRFTKDLVPIISHDQCLNRIFRSQEKVCDLDWGTLSIKYPQIPTLGSVLKKFGKKIHLMIEIKKEHYPEPSYQKKVLGDLLYFLEPGQDFHILSLDTEMFKLVDFLPTKTFLPVAEFNTKEMSEFALFNNCAGVAGHYLFLNQKTLKKHKEKGQIIGTGFISSYNCLYREINRGVDLMFTNSACSLMDHISE